MNGLFSKQKEMLKQIIDILPIAIYITDVEGRLEHFNTSAVNMLGWESEPDTEDWKDWKFYYPDGTPMRSDESPVTIATKENRSVKGTELIIEKQNGERVFCKVYSSPLYNEDDEVDGALNMLVDINDQKETISELKSAVEESEQQKRLYEAIISSTPDLIYVFDLNYRFTFVNDALLEMWGRTREESVGKRLREVGYEPWHAEMHEREIDQVVNTKEPIQGEVIFPHDKLGERFYDYIFVPVLNDEGEVEAVAGTTRDVTERKQAEQALRSNEEKYRTLVENFPKGAVGLFDKDFRFTAIGGELLDRLDVDPENRIGNKITDIYPEEIVNEVEPHLRATFNGEANNFEADLHGRHLFAQTLPIESESGEIDIGMIVALDITDRWQTQQALRESEKKYRTLFETMEEGFCILKLEFSADNKVEDFRYLEVNSSFEKHTGVKNAEGQKASELGLDPETDWVQVYANVALTGEQEHFEYYAKDLDRWFEISAFRVGDPQEHKVAGLFTNITGRKQAQEQLKSMNETLEEQVEERTESLVSYQNKLRSLVAELSKAEEKERQRLATELHDNLGQMLAVGKMKLAQVQNESLPDSAADNLDELAELMKDAITYTRELTSELKPPSSLDDKDLRAHINWIAEKMEKHNLEVTIEGDDKSKPLDKEVQMMLLQCVRELFFNVIKHTSVNEAVVRIKRHKEHLQISVIDEGKGFDPEGNETPDQEGGFGLFSIRERIDTIGGKVDIDSEPGKGTKVHLYVPLKDRDSVVSVPPDTSQEPEKPEKIKILLADDHQMIREGLRSIIEKEHDMKVIGEAADGEEAFTMSLEKNPDVVLMEINLPEMDGIEATHKILEEVPQIRIIGFSEQEDEEVTGAMRKAGASAFLSKKEAFKSLASSIRAEASA